MTPQAPTYDKAVIFTVDAGWLGYALLAAQRIITLSRPRDFDVIIASLEPLPIPRPLADLGIRNEVLNLNERVRAENLPLRWLPSIAYLRLWLPGIFREQYDRILYLDADTYLCSPDLSRLFDIDLGPHALAAALDKEHFWQGERPIIDFENHGIAANRYFNSGVLLIDTSAFAEQGLLAEMLAVNQSGITLKYHDQSLLNMAIQGQFAELSPRWNWQFPNRFPAYTRMARPCLIHFSNNPRPWQGYKEETRFPRPIIETYAGGDTSVPPDRKPLREPLLHQLDNLIGHVQYLPRYLRYMSRHKHPFETRL